MQVQIYVNDYPAWCSSEDGEGCSYEYDSSLNTEVTSITQSDGATTGDIDLTISGTGFTNEMDTVVKVGNDLMMCQPTSVASDEIVCTISQPKAGIYPVYVFTKSKGEAVYPDGGLEVDVPIQITSIDPLTGSLGGGNTLTVQGTGFSSRLPSMIVCFKS